MDLDEFQKIFEFEIRTKLARRATTTNEQIRLLYNSFRFYDFESSSIIDKNNWIKGIQKTGLCGFNINDLSDLFSKYDINNTGFINYRNFTYYIYGKEELLPLSKSFIEDNMKYLLLENKNRIKSPLIEFKPPGLYDRNFEIMLDNEKRYNKINDRIKELRKEEEEKNSFNNIKKFPDNDNNTLSIQNYSLYYKNDLKYNKYIKLLKSKININNGITYYTLMKELKYHQNQSNKTINLNSLYYVLRNIGIGFRYYDLIELFKYLDSSKTNEIKSDNLLELLRGDINERRKKLIENVFNMNEKEKKGKIKLNELKNLYNCKMHPDVYTGFKQEIEVFKEFCFTFDIFCNFYDIYEYINCDEFIKYYKGISAAIGDDNYFDDILNGVWNKNIISNKNIEKIISNNLSLNKNYNDLYKKELYENQINKTNDYVLNKRYVNNLNSNKFIYNNESNNLLPINEEEKNNYKILPYTPMPKETQLSSEKITPYYTPVKTHFNKGLRMFRSLRHSPITNEYIMNKENSKQNYKELNPYDTYYILKRDILNILSEIKQHIISRGYKGIFNFQKLFFLYDKEKSGKINYIKFIELCEIYNINIGRKKLKELFDFYDKEKIGLIKYDELIQDLIKDISIYRAIIIKGIYNNFWKDKYGNISINDIRKQFKASEHPFVKKGLKTEQEIYFEFIECLNIYKNYRSIIYNQDNIDSINYEGFLNYFKEVSLSIKDDKLFEDILINCFDDITFKNNRYKNNKIGINNGKQIING